MLGQIVGGVVRMSAASVLGAVPGALYAGTGKLSFMVPTPGP
jgi:hypothetical protein